MVLPFDFLVFKNPRLVLLRIDLNLEIMSRRLGADARSDLHRFTGGELRIHAGSRYTDALLSPAHAQPMKFGSVEKLRKNFWHLLADNARAVIDHGDSKSICLARWRRRIPIR